MNPLSLRTLCLFTFCVVSSAEVQYILVSTHSSSEPVFLLNVTADCMKPNPPHTQIQTHTHTHVPCFHYKCKTPHVHTVCWCVLFTAVLRDLGLTNPQTVIGPLELLVKVLIPVSQVQVGDQTPDTRVSTAGCRP